MTTINDIADLVRVLEEHPEWLHTLRGLIISDELAQLPRKVDALQEDMTQVKADVAELKADVAVLKTDVKQITGRLDNGFGANYERKVADNIGSIAGQHLLMRRPTVLRATGIALDPAIYDLVEQAEDAGRITPEQVNDLLRIDLIFTGRHRPDGAITHVAAELSITIGDDDITRASNRADILAQAINLPVLPAVIGSRIDRQRTALAAEKNVTVILEPD